MARRSRRPRESWSHPDHRAGHRPRPGGRADPPHRGRGPGGDRRRAPGAGVGDRGGRGPRPGPGDGVVHHPRRRRRPRDHRGSSRSTGPGCAGRWATRPGSARSRPCGSGPTPRCAPASASTCCWGSWTATPTGGPARTIRARRERRPAAGVGERPQRRGGVHRVVTRPGPDEPDRP